MKRNWSLATVFSIWQSLERIGLLPYPWPMYVTHIMGWMELAASQLCLVWMPRGVSYSVIYILLLCLIYDFCCSSSRPTALNYGQRSSSRVVLHSCTGFYSYVQIYRLIIPVYLMVSLGWISKLISLILKTKLFVEKTIVDFSSRFFVSPMYMSGAILATTQENTRPFHNSAIIRSWFNTFSKLPFLYLYNALDYFPVSFVVLRSFLQLHPLNLSFCIVGYQVKQYCFLISPQPPTHSVWDIIEYIQSPTQSYCRTIHYSTRAQARSQPS